MIGEAPGDVFRSDRRRLERWRETGDDVRLVSDAPEGEEGELEPPLAEVVRSCTAAHPYAVLGGAAAVGWLLGGGLIVRALGLGLGMALRATVRVAAAELGRHAAQAFLTPAHGGETDFDEEENPESLQGEPPYFEDREDAASRADERFARDPLPGDG